MKKVTFEVYYYHLLLNKLIVYVSITYYLYLYRINMNYKKYLMLRL